MAHNLTDPSLLMPLPEAANMRAGWNGTEILPFHGPAYTAEQMRTYAAAAVAAERARPRQTLAYMATSPQGTVRFTVSPDAARELEGYGWAVTPLGETRVRRHDER